MDYIAISFVSENEEELYKVDHYEIQVFPVSDLTEINKTHEQRIRAALEYCLWKFINDQKVNTTHNLIKNGTMSKASFIHEESSFEPYVPLGKWFNMLTFKKTTDKYSDGWNVAYTGFSDNEKDLIIPFVIGRLLIPFSEPRRLLTLPYAVFCVKKKNTYLFN